MYSKQIIKLHCSSKSNISRAVTFMCADISNSASICRALRRGKSRSDIVLSAILPVPIARAACRASCVKTSFALDRFPSNSSVAAL